MSDATALGDIPPSTTDDSSTSTPPASAPPSGLPDWLTGVDEEIARDPSLKVFNNPQDLIKSYVHAQKMLGKDKTILPSKNSSDIEWRQFYQKLGVPSELEAYKINKGEKYIVDDGVMQEFNKLAFESNLLPNQAQKVMDWFNEKASTNMGTANAQREADMKSGWDNLSKEWGAGFEKNMTAAKNVIKEFGDESFVKYLNESGLGDDPKLAQFLAKIGSGFKEDTFQEGVAEHLGMTPQEAKSKYNQIVSNPDSAYRNASHPDHKNAVAMVNKLFEVM